MSTRCLRRTILRNTHSTPPRSVSRVCSPGSIHFRTMRGGLDDRAVARARSACRRPDRGVDDKPAGARVAGGLASHRRAMARHPSKLSPLHETGASHRRPAFCAPPHSVCCATRAPERRREREPGRKRGGGGRSGERGRPERRIDGIPFAHRSHHIRVRRPRCCSARGLHADRRDKLLKLLDTGGQNCTPNNIRLPVSRQGQTTSPGGSLLRRPSAESSTGVDTSVLDFPIPDWNARPRVP